MLKKEKEKKCMINVNKVTSIWYHVYEKETIVKVKR